MHESVTGLLDSDVSFTQHVRSIKKQAQLYLPVIFTLRGRHLIEIAEPILGLYRGKARKDRR